MLRCTASLTCKVEAEEAADDEEVDEDDTDERPGSRTTHSERPPNCWGPRVAPGNACSCSLPSSSCSSSVLLLFLCPHPQANAGSCLRHPPRTCHATIVARKDCIHPEAVEERKRMKGPFSSTSVHDPVSLLPVPSLPLSLYLSFSHSLSLRHHRPLSNRCFFSSFRLLRRTAVCQIKAFCN
jgi:hypothetical protein